MSRLTVLSVKRRKKMLLKTPGLSTQVHLKAKSTLSGPEHSVGPDTGICIQAS